MSLLVLAACSSADESGSTDDSGPAAVSTTVADTGPSDDFSPVASDSVAPESTPGSSPVTTPPPSVTHPAVRTTSGDGLVQPVGVTAVTARVTSAAGDVCDVCLWLADSQEERARGLMGVTDLGDAVGMAFVWDAPTTGNFFMLGTPTPLSIAWFGTDGEHVNETDMEPCITEDSATCERYEAGAPYEVAIEMFQGELGVIGIGPGSSIELLAESPTCPT